MQEFTFQATCTSMFGYVVLNRNCAKKRHPVVRGDAEARLNASCAAKQIVRWRVVPAEGELRMTQSTPRLEQRGNPGHRYGNAAAQVSPVQFHEFCAPETRPTPFYWVLVVSVLLYIRPDVRLSYSGTNTSTNIPFGFKLSPRQ